jgi:site-specific DNA recombinase
MSKKAAAKEIASGAAAKRGVLYARVSSKEQEREGYSIPAQLKLLRDYAEAQNIKIVEEYIDIETAKQSGRTNFNEMVHFLRKHPTVRSLLVEKTDRLYRNLKDWVTIDELDAEVHFAKEGVVHSNDSRSSEKFMHGIKVLMAKNYIDNLSEEARKGMREKAEQGIWPTKAPLGYRNVPGPDGKNIIAVDPEYAPVITRLFEWYTTGLYSLKDLSKRVRQEGLVYRKSRAPVPMSAVHKILRTRLYTGTFEWRGELYKGTHQPLVTHELWAQVQEVLDGRRTKRQGLEQNFAFSGLIKCAHCGCALVAEIKKGRYIYYHCTGFKGKCGEPYVREEVLERQFARHLAGLRIDEEVFDWIVRALRESCADEKREHSEAIARIQAEWDRLQKRVDTMYIDKLDGKIDDDFYRRMRAQWRDEQERCEREIERQRAADDSYMDQGIQILNLAQNAHRVFAAQPAEEKRKLLNFLLSNCTWQRGTLIVELKEPFDMLAETVAAAARLEAADGTEMAQKEIWLGD